MRNAVVSALLLFLALNLLWFVAHALHLGSNGLFADHPEDFSRVFINGAPLANAGISVHMMAGALLTLGAPLQALPIVRNRWPNLHRKNGYVLFVLAMMTGIGGLSYIIIQGTIGGWWMSFWFATYGSLLMWSAMNTVRFAIARDFDRHFAWATRLIVLAVGSWIFRMHYVLWFIFTDGLGSNEGLTGIFDRVQVVAFFLPYLLIAELLLRRRAAASIGAEVKG
ncbi:DUF2306 domain-containing protein [Marimonas sp. MJW-29]|uniref:DUF2306 domain-containing protein n=1 Tax=Sulfitobacter sediminis TaxID=3234186 RepID=A0ABV3RPJ3_9RHOB